MTEKIRASITEEHDIPPDAIVLVRAHSVPKNHQVEKFSDTPADRNSKTTNCLRFRNGSHGRTYAAQDRENCSNHDLEWRRKSGPDVVAAEGLSPDVVEAVVYFVKDAAREQAKNLSLDTNIVHLGLDSLVRTEIAGNLQTAFGGVIPEEVLQESETVREVAKAIQTHVGTKPVVEDYRNMGKGTGVARAAGPVPESYYKLEKMPEFVRLQRMKKIIESTGLRNPFLAFMMAESPTQHPLMVAN